jgi:hypothetical protein
MMFGINDFGSPSSFPSSTSSTNSTTTTFWNDINTLFSEIRKLGTEFGEFIQTLDKIYHPALFFAYLEKCPHENIVIFEVSMHEIICIY